MIKKNLGNRLPPSSPQCNTLEIPWLTSPQAYYPTHADATHEIAQTYEQTTFFKPNFVVKLRTVRAPPQTLAYACCCLSLHTSNIRAMVASMFLSCICFCGVFRTEFLCCVLFYQNNSLEFEFLNLYPTIAALSSNVILKMEITKVLYLVSSVWIFFLQVLTCL